MRIEHRSMNNLAPCSTLLPFLTRCFVSQLVSHFAPLVAHHVTHFVPHFVSHFVADFVYHTVATPKVCMWPNHGCYSGSFSP